MYTLKEWWTRISGAEPIDGWDGKMLCLETDAQMTSLTNQTQVFLACYTFTLVTRGELTLTYNGREIRLRAGDLYIYSPGMAVTVNAISDDYRGFCLLADESTTLETPVARDMISLAYKPVMLLTDPKLTLPAETAASFEARMREIIAYLHSDNLY
ncbi:MAG: AraC family ligand binding domain-containing protein, partial [Bacteroidales bacterium]|nr:AraC family ligand binding domain-containing protein [Bacteroidales bacterium]